MTYDPLVYSYGRLHTSPGERVGCSRRGAWDGRRPGSRSFRPGAGEPGRKSPPSHVDRARRSIDRLGKGKAEYRRASSRLACLVIRMSMSTPPGQHILDRDAYLNAVAAIEQFGDRATQYAAGQSTRHEKRDDFAGSSHWDRVIVAILELERTWLRSDESCH